MIREDDDSRRLPPLAAGDQLKDKQVDADQHFTQPPPRFSEATLVKRMEELGIGRPSTYASTMAVLVDRDYVKMEKKRLVPEDKGRLVIAFLESFFMRYVEYDFTADLEEKLDLISNNELQWRDVLRDFWRDFTAAVAEIKDLRVGEVLEALNEMLGPQSSRRRKTAATRGRAQVRRGQARASRFPGSTARSSAAETILTATSRASLTTERQWGSGARRQGLGLQRRRRRGDGQNRTLRTVSAARRNGGRRKAKALKPADAASTRRRSISNARCSCCRCRARSAIIRTKAA